MSSFHLSNALARDLLGQAVLAPSSHNTQPWRFRLSASAIDVLADRRRALPVNDPDDRELTISCGCALMNLRIAAARRELGTETTLLPDACDPDWLARMSFVPSAGAPADQAALAEAIPLRHSCRRPFEPIAIPAATAPRLVAAAAAEGAWLRPLSEAGTRTQLASLVTEGDMAQWADTRWRRELAAWMHPRQQGDGLSVPALAASLTQLLVRTFNLGEGMAAKDRTLAESAPLLAVLGTDKDDPRHWLLAGQALQRVLLVACRLGLQAAYLNQPVQVARLRPVLHQLTGGDCAQLVLCLGYPRVPLAASPRRPLEEVIGFPS
ncbi:Acg family FMN-binding oxidoreductase [Zobellella sp. DQSA1]|uniref:Acg family FMN-binding oxidoreductase n=1 Tax=Zobellella sp. DQSA1 TaxID=3342386 RepID=UPI0035C16007